MITNVRFPYSVAVTSSQRAGYKVGQDGVASIVFDGACLLRFTMADGSERQVVPPPGTVVEHGEIKPLSGPVALEIAQEQANDGPDSSPPPARPIAGVGRKARR